MSLSPRVIEVLDRWVDLFMYRSMQDLLAFFHERGISMTQYSVCMRLFKQGPCAVSELAALLNTSRSAASQLIDRMFAQGLVVRAESAEDRRFTEIALTPAGETLTRECIAARTRWLANAPPVPDETAEAIVAGLEALLAALAPVATAESAE